MLAGLEGISDGEIRIGERVVNKLPPRERDIAMVFQDYALYPHKTVYDNMAFSLKVRGVPAAEIKTRIAQAAEMLGIGQLLERKPSQLSGGQRQRVAMGRAIVRRPQVFLFDEPLSNLDAKLRVAMRAEIKALHQRLKTTTVYVTHDQIEAMTMADRIVVMHDGIVEQIGTPLELFDRPGNLFVAQFIGSPAMNILEGTMRVQGGRSYVEAQGAQWPVDPGVRAQDGQKVHYGIRPGDIKVSTEGEGIPAKVIVVEPTGAETELLLQVGDAQLVVVMHGRTKVQPDDLVRLKIEGGASHLFDGASGNRMDSVTLQ
jgi:multiple sugar transport system ATP-binding protein